MKVCSVSCSTIATYFLFNQEIAVDKVTVITKEYPDGQEAYSIEFKKVIGIYPKISSALPSVDHIS